VLIKICCIQNDTEVEMAAAAGATHVGLVAAMPSGPGPIAADRIAEIVGAVPTGVTAVLLTAHTDADSIIGHARTTGVTAVQIVGEVPADVRLSIKAAAGSIDILQVVHVGGPEALEQAQPAAVGSDFVLLDSGRPSALVPELGGTGRTHDWQSAPKSSRASTFRSSWPVASGPRMSRRPFARCDRQVSICAQEYGTRRGNS
jgi:phosphoribosylanthranilate isomerase